MMMHEENDFTVEGFLDPPAFLWPGYFWVLNDTIDENRLIEQIHDMHRHMARSVCILPEPPEFRPIRFATQLDRPYLGSSYMEMIRIIVEECEKLGMNFWLYDEGGWPSGGACGQVYAQDPIRYSKKALVFSESSIGKDQTYRVPKTVVCVALKTRNGWNVYRPGETIKGLKNDTTLRVFYLENCSRRSDGGAPAPNILSEQVVRTFIDLTHERYKQYLGNYFGKSIRFTFTDEPSVSRTTPTSLTWTDDMVEVFHQEKGYDLLDYVPVLLQEPSDTESEEITRARIDFYDVWSQLFVKRYLEPIRDWCKKHQLLSGGHFDGDHDPRYNADSGGYGHILRAMRGLDLPGIDSIWRQTFPGLRSYPFPKYASSVARQMGQPYVLTESFGVYGNGLTPGQMKWITDQQYVRGANLMIVPCYPYSTRDQLMVGERPHFGPVNPLWKYMDIYHAYTARLGYLLTRGKPVCTTAVYYDIRSIWAGASARKQAIELHEAVAETLLSCQCDFDFIDDDILAQSPSENGHLTVGTMRYDTVVVPATQWMAPEAIDGLKRFVESGGNLLIIGGPINGFDKSTENIEMDNLPQRVKPLVRFEKPCKDIRTCKRIWDNVSFYLLTSESPERIKIKAFFEEQTPAVLCDLEQGKLYPLENSSLEFEPWGSMAVLFGIEADENPIQIPTKNKSIQLETGWKLKPIRQYRVGEHDFEIIECSDAKPSAIALGDWKNILGEHFSGDAEYMIEFDCPQKLASAPARLELGDVKYACEVFLNGNPVGRRVWLPYSLDISGMLKPGQNRLHIIVTNTLANALLDPKVENEWYSRTGPGWPLSGQPYDKMSRNFEKDSLPSGLYGPVHIVF